MTNEAEKMAVRLEVRGQVHTDAKHHEQWGALYAEAAAIIRRLAAENAALKAELKQEQEDHSEMLLIAHLDGLTKNREAHAKELVAQAERIKRLEEALDEISRKYSNGASANTLAYIARAALEPRDE